MLKDQPVILSLTVNILLGILWHYAVFILCITRKDPSFSEKRILFLPRKWENGGRFYSDILKINKWKDLLPQHIGKNGFSKDHLSSVSLEYIDRFILETCRGEWDHKMNCLFVIVLFAMNGLLLGTVLSILIIAGNLPFIMIQRYNRLRLQRLRSLLLRKSEKKLSNNNGIKNQRTEF